MRRNGPSQREVRPINIEGVRAERLQIAHYRELIVP